MTTTAKRFIIGTATTDSGQYVGVLRHGRRVVFECSHVHHNRDISTGHRASARDCITDLVSTVRLPARVQWYRDRLRTTLNAAIARGAISQASAERWRVQREEELVQFEISHARLAEILGDAPVYTAGDRVAFPPPAPQATCVACGVAIQPTRWVPEHRSGQPWQDWRAVRVSISAELARCGGDSLCHPAPVDAV